MTKIMLEQIKKQIIKMLPPDLGVQEVDLVIPPDSKMGDLSLPCFDLAKKLCKNPAEVAKEAAAGFRVKPKMTIEKVETTGPYVNFFLNAGSLASLVLSEIEKKKNKFGTSTMKKGQKILIEYPSNNTHKEVHVGHLRIMCLGNALANLYETTGAEVIRVNYINDFGTHVAKCLWGLMNLHKGEKPPVNKQKWLGEVYVEASNYLKEHPEPVEESKELLRLLEAKDKKIWKLFLQTRQWSLDGFKKIFKEMGVKHKTVFYEKDVKDLGQKVVDELLKKKIAQIGEGGAIIIDLKKYALDIALLRKSDGAGLYLTSDLGLAKVKAQKFSKVTGSVNLTGAEQKFYFQQLFKILEFGGFKYQMSHVACELVTLPDGSKMSSRAGNVILYEMVRDEALSAAYEETKKRHLDWGEAKLKKTAVALGFGALKFSMIKVGSNQKIAFDAKEALSFDGFTAPYLQYSLARINSIIKKAKNNKSKISSAPPVGGLDTRYEKQLLLKMATLEETIVIAAERQDPSQLAKYLFELARYFSDFYENCPVLKASTTDLQLARLELVKATKIVLEKGLGILGVPVIKEM